MKKIGKLLFLSAMCFMLAIAFTACSNQTYRITFETGCEVTADAVEAKKDGEEVILPVIKRSGYEFCGWYESEDLSGSPVEKVKPTADTTYYAKWAKLYTLTLDTDGGELNGSTLSLKAGDNLLTILDGKTPKKQGLVFGGWFIGKKSVTAQNVMPSSDLTVVAKYKAEYTVEIYERKTEKDNFEKTGTEKGYAFVGESFTVDNEKEGLTEITTEQTKTTINSISEKSANNIFKRFFEVKKIDFTFVPGYDGSQTRSETVALRYGDEYEFSADTFTRKGYMLVGWKSDADGKTYSVKRVVFNDENSSEKGDEITVKKDDVFTAVWNKGYANSFGGDDYIYLFDEQPKTAYFVRGGLVFKGDYVASRKEFYFEDENEDIIIEGKINDDYTFSYKVTKLTDVSAMLYTVENGVEKDTKIVFGNNDRIIYTDKNGSSEGYFRLDENGLYTATLTSGELKGESIVFVLSSSSEENEDTGVVENVTVFRLRNEEEYGLGTVLRAAVSDGKLVYYPKAYSLTFSGFGTVAYLNIRSGAAVTENYYCIVDGDKVNLKNAEDELIGTIKTFEIGSQKCYMFYDERLDDTFTDENGATLTLDGLYTAKYVAGGTINGIYEVEDSVFDGKIITLTSGDGTHKFVLKENSTSSGVIGEEQGELETTYNLSVKGKDYREYYYGGENTVYYAPLFVLGNNGAGTASLYGYTSKSTFVLMSSGTYSTDEISGKTTYTATYYATEESVADALSSPFNLKNISSFDCFLSTFSSGNNIYSVSYWFSYEKGENKTTLSVEYSSASGEKLQIVGKAAYYSSADFSVAGSFENGGETFVITYFDGVNKKLYLKCNDEELTFARLDDMPYVAYYREKNGTSVKTKYIESDGKGGGKYVDNGSVVVGTIVKKGESAISSVDVYSFKSNDKTIAFDFIKIGDGYSVYDSAYDKTYDSVKDGVLVLDGYGYCSYTANGETVYKGVCALTSETVVTVSISGKTRYFDLFGQSFTLRGDEYGEYAVIDNNYAPYKEFYQLDGYGKIKSFTVNSDGSVVYGAQGEYVLTDGRVNFTIKNGAERTDGEFAIGNGTITYKEIRYNVLITVHKEKVNVYVNTKDWSILILDDAGGAVRISEDGKTDEGGYTLVTDNLLYFFTSDGTDACIYRYDYEKGTAIPVKFSNRGYYTTELESLLFSEYGFAIFGGTERCYYDLEGNNVVIFRKDQTQDVNKYGFRKENFGAFENQKTYNGKTYYSNNGYAVKFVRAEEGKDKFPVTLAAGSTIKYPLSNLSFAPDGQKEFRVDAVITINGRGYVAYVRREIDGENQTHTYLEAGNYTFEIVLDYKGENEPGSGNEGVSTYTVISMKSVISASAYRYLDNYYRAYVTNGAKYAAGYKNDIGTVYVNSVYDENGEQTGSYVSATFGNGSEFYDANGNIIAIEEADFEYDQENSMYIVRFTASDGFNYEFAFGLRYHSKYKRTFGYYVFYFVRTETLTASGGYEVTAKRIIGSDNKNLSLGMFYAVTLKKDGTEIPYHGAIISGDKTELRYISREISESGTVVSSTYYAIKFDSSSGAEVGGNDKVLATYASVSVEKIDMLVWNSADGKVSIDAENTGNAVLLTIDNAVSLVSSTTFDEATGVYTIVAGGKTYTFKLNSDLKTIVDFSETTEE